MWADPMAEMTVSCWAAMKDEKTAAWWGWKTVDYLVVLMAAHWDVMSVA